MGKQYIIGDTGYTFITAEWVPDPDKIVQALVSFAQAIEDWSVPLEDSMYAVRDSVRRRFETETDPYGRPWKSLNEKYAADKLAAGYDEGILVRTGAMYAEATTISSYNTNPLNKTIDFDASTFQEAFYAGWHQAGLPARTNPLPQRMFVGVDEEGAAEIQAIFTEWLDIEWNEYWHQFTKGEMVTSSAGQSGRFSGVHAFGSTMSDPSFMVRGFVGGHFVKGTVPSGTYRGGRTRGGRYAGM
jgi:phage gpG-like protein